jgi:hypothetical protein
LAGCGYSRPASSLEAQKQIAAFSVSPPVVFRFLKQPARAINLNFLHGWRNRSAKSQAAGCADPADRGRLAPSDNDHRVLTVLRNVSAGRWLPACRRGDAGAETVGEQAKCRFAPQGQQRTRVQSKPMGAQREQRSSAGPNVFRSIGRWGTAGYVGTFLTFLMVHGSPWAAGGDPLESATEKIKRALSAGPANITDDATVADIDPDGRMKILRQGTNDFTCMPGDPTGIGVPPMCADKVAMQWNNDFAQHKAKPSTTVPGIEYMLAGATQRSDTDPFDKTSPPISIGPHWMILWPFDPNLSGLPTTHRAKGAYIMWAGTPWAHLHIMGAPQGAQ